MSNHQDIDFMMQALLLANNGAGYVSPNPMVGALLVHEGQMIGAGYHSAFGTEHAEVNCIASVAAENADKIAASTLYVTLEPCNHFGKTPPCTDFIIKNGIKKVVVAAKDLNAKVNGAGIQKLRDNGVDVTEDICTKEATALNRRFFHYHTAKRPYIILKWAETKDGFVSTSNQEQTSISCAKSNELVHQWRAHEDAILVGYQTALVDNPRLNVRHTVGIDPIRIILDPKLSLPEHLHIKDGQQRTIIFNNITQESKPNFELNKADNWAEYLDKAYDMNILSILVEGGPKTINALIELDLWDEARIIKSPIEFGNGYAAAQLKNETFLYQQPSDIDTIFHYKNQSNKFL